MKFQYRHIIYWVVYSFLLYFLLAYSTHQYDLQPYFISLLVIQIAIFYLNFSLLIPLFFNNGKNTIFLISNLFFIILSAFGISYIEEIMATSPKDEFALEPLLAHSMPAIAAIFVAFLVTIYLKEKNRKEEELIRIKAEKNFLIQQINPHFLFNTLNNIYSLVIQNNPKGGDAVLQLSKMLDYSLYRSNDEQVLLSDEIQYINNFIALFKLKDSSIKGIKFQHDNVFSQSKISPMLLLTFIENAFKHGNIEDVENSYIDITIASTQNDITFQCKNSFSKKKKTDKTGGIGIKNVRRRLELIYPSKHTLHILENEGTFSVSLNIITDEA
ncbi:sensor histidine kinase [Tenacibaculum amylolyticum]|uniref:sensor histidine kinase n=1 Tax=Tenacibaculum amylolyticum TaxID=104269 RepID=UPI003895DC76